MVNTQKKYQEMYEELGGLNTNPQLLQSFVLSNNADIVKAIEYFKANMQPLGSKDKLHKQSIITRLENIMIQRLMVTEDVYLKLIGTSSSLDETDEGVQKNTKKGKVVDMHGNEVKGTLKAGPKFQSGDVTKKQMAEKNVLAEEERKLESVKKENERLLKESPHYNQRYQTDKEKIEAIHDWLLPRLDEMLQDKKHGKEKWDKYAIQYCKFHFLNYGKNIHFCDDTSMFRFLEWVKSGSFPSRSPLAVIRGELLSITDLISEAERAVIELGLSGDKLKKYMKPHVLKVRLKEWDEEKTLIATDEEYDQFFRSTLAFVESDKHRKMLETQKVQASKTREDLKAEVYEEFKSTGERAVGKMASKLHQMLTALGTDTKPIDRISEVINFLKAKAPELINLHELRTAKKKDLKPAITVPSIMDTVESQKEQRIKNQKKKEKKETSNIDELHTIAEEDEKKEEVVVDAETTITEPAVETSTEIFPKFEEKLKYLSKLDEVKEVILTALNKDGELLGEEKLMSLCREKFLADDKMTETADFTEEDVVKWIELNIEPYTSEEYAILGAKDEEEFKECLTAYTKKFTPGQEKKRLSLLKDVLESKIPRSQFARSVAKSVRKGRLAVVNGYFKDLNETALNEEKKKLEKNKD